nr:hypothetical protein [uncultured Methanoregula sp.]
MCCIRSRYCFSIRYLQSAAFFCRQGYEIEKKFLENQTHSTQISTEHFAFISNAIFSSVSYLEATINEFFADVADDQIWDSDESFQKKIELFKNLWDLDVPKTAHYSILKKYEIALAIAEKPSFDKGSIPYQNVKILIQLRNYLMHFEPEWIEIQPRNNKDCNFNEHKFARLFRGKFEENPLAHKIKPFFPEKCLGHGCAEWAVKNSVSFTDDFFQKLDFPTPFDNLKENLLTR